MFSFDFAVFLAVFIPLFTIMDPLAVVPLFFERTALKSKGRTLSLALEATLVATALLLIFAFLQEHIFTFFHISTQSFQIAGGLLLLYLAFEMFTGNMSSTRTADRDDPGAVPFGTPLLAGPGALTAAIVFSANPAIGLPYTALAILACAVITFAVLMSSTLIFRLIGKNGIKIITRIFGLLIAAIGVEFIRMGLMTWLTGIVL